MTPGGTSARHAPKVGGFRFDGRDVISVRDFSRDEILHILDTAARLDGETEARLEGKVLATLFF